MGYYSYFFCCCTYDPVNPTVVWYYSIMNLYLFEHRLFSSVFKHSRTWTGPPLELNHRFSSEFSQCDWTGPLVLFTVLPKCPKNQTEPDFDTTMVTLAYVPSFYHINREQHGLGYPVRVAGTGTCRYVYGSWKPYPWAFERLQKHIFWSKTEGDTANFVKFIELGYISSISGPFWTFLGLF